MTEQVATQEAVRASRIGKLPVPIPKGVTVAVSSGTVNVKGGKGALSWKLPEGTAIEIKDDNVHVMANVGRGSARMQGLVRALVANMVKGASDGFSKRLLLVGTGYRAEIKGKELVLSVGLSHTVVFPIPSDVQISVPADSKGTVIDVVGVDRAQVGQTAARIRNVRPPEPYGGKGIRYQGERVREKAGKSGKAGAR
ncbi:MAG: 50S ribosomal protein L6 [Sorangium cellulosum]|nr:MAG: 50S ribosomal protein L6 [Sorangium cellulosum]